MVTIKTMAAHFRLSTATISKALNGLPGVSDDVRKKIVAYAEQNNYVPNMYGKGLKGKGARVLGVIIPDNVNLSYSSTIKGIEKEAGKHGYSITLCITNEDWRQECKSLEMLIQKRVDGVLIIPAPLDDEEPARRYDPLEQARVPYALLNRRIDGCLCDVVETDNVRAGEMAVDFLVAKGHKRIIHIAPLKNTSTGKARAEGFRRAMRRHRCKFTERDIYTIDDSSFESCKTAMMEIIGQRKDFTAVTASHDNMAFGLMKGIIAMKKRIPQDIALIGYDDNQFAEISLVPLTTVPQESEYIGVCGVAMIMERINSGRTRPRQTTIVPGKVVVRESV